MISWIATILSLTGNFLVNKKNIVGFYVWILSNILWVIVALQIPNYAQVTLFVCYALLNIHGIWSWRKSQ